MKLIAKSNNYLLNINKNWFDLEKNLMKKIVLDLKKERLIIIKWIKWVWKTKTISYILSKSKIKDSFLYINKSLDLENKIKNDKSLNEILNQYIKCFQKPKLIILENIESIENIKDFINLLYSHNYTIIIIWNSISIWNKPEIEINSERKFDFYLLDKEREYVEVLKTKNTIFEEIIKIYSLKSFELYNYSLIFLSNFNKIASIREINRKLNKNIKISLFTMMEYIKYSLNALILKQIYVFDFKKNKKIKSKTKYYFSDTNFRNSLYDFSLEQNKLKENFLFNELYKSWYDINSWLNWNYNFTFYWNKIKKDECQNIIKIDTIFIDFCIEKDKKNIKKQIKKLLKIPEIPYNIKNKECNLKQNFSKYLILDEKKDIWIKKFNYENLKIINLNQLLKII